MRWIVFTLVPALVLIARPACAIVLVDQAITGPETEGVHQTLHLSGDLRRGDTRRATLGADWLLGWRHGAHTEFLLAEYARGTSRGAVDLDRAFGHLRHRTQLSTRWAIEAFAQLERDPFARLRRRTLLGAGMRLTLFAVEGERAAFLGIGAFDEDERYASGIAPARQRLVRGNLYLLWKQRLSEAARLDAIGYLQPALRDGADRRALFKASLQVKAGDGIDLEIGIDWSFDARPPPGAAKTNARTTTGVSLSF